MKIMGIDGSSKMSGIAVFDGQELVYSGFCGATSSDLIKRIHKMVDSIEEAIRQNPDIDKIILEEVLPENAKGNIKTHKALMWLQGAIAIMVHDNFPNTEIEYIMPNSWRAAVGIHTGRGIKRAELKAADIKFVKDKFGKDVNDDEADAILIAYSQVLKENSEYNWE